LIVHIKDALFLHLKDEILLKIMLRKFLIKSIYKRHIKANVTYHHADPLKLKPSHITTEKNFKNYLTNLKQVI